MQANIKTREQDFSSRLHGKYTRKSHFEKGVVISAALSLPSSKQTAIVFHENQTAVPLAFGTVRAIKTEEQKKGIGRKCFITF